MVESRSANCEQLPGATRDTAAEVGANLRYRARSQPEAPVVACEFALSLLVCAGFLARISRLGAESQGAYASGKLPDTSKKANRCKTETDITLVNVTVTDPYGRLVTGLEQDNFRVFEDNVEQEIVRFSSEDVPISIGVIFDMSGSMADKFEKSRLAAVQFFRTANPQDEFFLVNFNDRAQLASPFTASVEELQNRLMFTAAQGRDGAVRWNLSGPEPDERSTQRKESVAHHIGRRR